VSGFVGARRMVATGCSSPTTAGVGGARGHVVIGSGSRVITESGVPEVGDAAADRVQPAVAIVAPASPVGVSVASDGRAGENESEAAFAIWLPTGQVAMALPITLRD
jgi:hypothetical protein